MCHHPSRLLFEVHVAYVRIETAVAHAEICGLQISVIYIEITPVYAVGRLLSQVYGEILHSVSDPFTLKVLDVEDIFFHRLSCRGIVPYMEHSGEVGAVDFAAFDYEAECGSLEFDTFEYEIFVARTHEAHKGESGAELVYMKKGVTGAFRNGSGVYYVEVLYDKGCERLEGDTAQGDARVEDFLNLVYCFGA